MNATDKSAFATSIVGCLQEVYEKSVTSNTLSVWFAALQAYPLEAVQAAIQNHITDPERGRFAPKPADIIGRIVETVSDDRPGPDEAWGLLLRVIRDERETGMLTDEMRAGWQACGPILEVGDEVVLYGRQGDQEITMEEIEEIVGTISYEIVCAISRRVPRVYVRTR